MLDAMDQGRPGQGVMHGSLPNAIPVGGRLSIRLNLCPAVQA